MSQENSSATKGGQVPQLILYWAVVGVPLAWGVYKTLLKVPALFQ